jgi:hypothetical protein
MDRFPADQPGHQGASFIADDGTRADGFVGDPRSLRVRGADRHAPDARRPKERLATLRLVGLALAACDKCVAVVYENEQRPAERRHAPWLERVSAQANAAFEELELDGAACRRGSA